ncbi:MULTISPECIES: DUF1654 domain-containing protein [Pseudomonas syringae group]|uniref:ATP-dependent Clp protease ATP-binding protein n=2 Tax=Pseudomonas syringae group TaxID=136849 RepID=A0A0P9P2F3_PSECA|nr:MULTISPECIES: DUF1654 domain-containing protein [Pseudomonas syringae group]KAA8713824.1 DUF1654 domain-containing protein [Pseudomonas cannabina]KPC32861.1 ATP-dependent Clp protease ATP-binding protein [Pseudomonas syringae pv. cilantro]KPW78144.1 ATP-dependent Clp protease ATP-binding protein [Pseudomonas syringae pv. coriandricola]KPW78441.1 ATP-dependent Clp protease ATP-binding protein [Pseudomonas cannabina]RMN24435.1 ATP-dependent Clp protease ATP-binding protein [Pseudomonas cannab
MANHNNSTSSAASSYELIGRRIQRLVSAPDVQKIQWVIVTRKDDEPLDSWDRVLREIEETEGIQVDSQQDGSVRIGWQRYIDN